MLSVGKVLVKKRHILLLFCAVLLMAGGAYYVLYKPPSAEYLKENPEHFRFDKSWSTASLLEALNAMFPKGVKRSQLEKILIETASATKSSQLIPDMPGRYFPGADQQGRYKVIYFKKRQNNTAWSVTAVFNKQDKLEKISTSFIDTKSMSLMSYLASR